MKKLIAISLLIVSLVLIFSFSSANDSLPQNVYLSISCDNNFIFSRYDVDIYIDTVKISTLSHGQKASYTISTTIGSHTIWFYKFDNYDVKGSLAFNFTNDTDISCKIHCRNNRIDVSNESVIPKPTPEPTPIPPYHLTLDTIELFLAKGESQTVSAKIENLAANKTLDFKWFSSNPEIASCSDGIIKGESSGTTTITCSTSIPRGIELKDELVVHVYVPVDSVSTEESELTLNIGRTHNFHISVLPDDATQKNLTFFSSCPSIASIDSEGIITALSAGQATITATSTDGSNKSVSIQVTVIDNRGSLGKNVGKLTGKSTGIVCSYINDQLPILSVLFRRPVRLAALFANLISRQLNRIIDDLNLVTVSSDDLTTALVGLSVKSQDELLMALRNPIGSFMLVSIVPSKNIITYGIDVISYDDAEAFIKESSKTYTKITSQDMNEVNDAADSIENP